MSAAGRPGRRSPWGRVFAWFYDRPIAATERAGLSEVRGHLLAHGRADVLEIGAETGLNSGHYGREVTSLALTKRGSATARRPQARRLGSPEVVR